MRTPDKLSTVGLKVTSPRLVVLKAFQQHDRRHLSADDVKRWTDEHGSKLGLGTIYRVLNHLTEVGILARMVVEGHPTIYELQENRAHHHIVCRGCGRVDEFTDRVIAQRSRQIAKSSGYTISHHPLALYGYCSGCLAPH